MRYLALLLPLFSTPALAEPVKIPWKGTREVDYFAATK